ncbi:hypothetical protein Ddc_14141 [Ditylenchus destructor]|nr:hypothetical protein Ddc_14141 [Ditylenchus destructor]
MKIAIKSIAPSDVIIDDDDLVSQPRRASLEIVLPKCFEVDYSTSDYPLPINYGKLRTGNSNGVNAIPMECPTGVSSKWKNSLPSSKYSSQACVDSSERQTISSATQSDVSEASTQHISGNIATDGQFRIKRLDKKLLAMKNAIKCIAPSDIIIDDYDFVSQPRRCTSLEIVLPKCFEVDYSTSDYPLLINYGELRTENNNGVNANPAEDSASFAIAPKTPSSSRYSSQTFVRGHRQKEHPPVKQSDLFEDSTQQTSRTNGITGGFGAVRRGRQASKSDPNNNTQTFSRVNRYAGEENIGVFLYETELSSAKQNRSGHKQFNEAVAPKSSNDERIHNAILSKGAFQPAASVHLSKKHQY